MRPRRSFSPLQLGIAFLLDGAGSLVALVPAVAPTSLVDNPARSTTPREPLSISPDVEAAMTRFFEWAARSPQHQLRSVRMHWREPDPERRAVVWILAAEGVAEAALWLLVLRPEERGEAPPEFRQ